ncbi:hypothetical protein D3C87_1204350 [compost metagenome]
MVHGGNQVRAHLEHEDRQGERGGNEQGAPQPLRLALATRAVLVVRIRCFGGQAAGLVARLLNRRFEVGRGDDSGQVAHPRALGRQVDAGLEHARDLCQRLLDPAHARRAGHVLDGEFGGLFAHGVAGAFDGPHGRLRVGRAGEADVGALGGQVDRGRLHAGDGLQRALDAADA